MALPQKPVSTKSQAEAGFSEAPIIEHLRELRMRLLWVLAVFGVCVVPCFYFAEQIFLFLLAPFMRVVGETQRLELIYTAPQEFFFTQMKLAFFGAIFIGFPVFATQIYRFIAPGLYARERRVFLPFLIAAPLLFIGGATLVYLGIMPLALSFFFNMQILDGVAEIRMVSRVSEYLSFAMTLMLAFGICFQLPIVLMLLGRAGIISADDLRRKRRYAVVLVFLAAAILTPPDIISQIGLGVPVLLLYELSILGVQYFQAPQARKSEAD